MSQTIEQALEWARSHIEWLEARALMRHALACDSAYLIAYAGTELDEPRLREFRTLVERRITGEPVAYLTGAREFYGLTFKVTPAVLIPRPETELLVDAALERTDPDRACRLLDLATGSGCVAIAVAAERPAARVIATDASADAAALARENAAHLGVDNVEIRTGSWFEPVASERFAGIVANPPYVAEGDPHLGEGDLRFEPHEALSGGTDGLACIRAIIDAAAVHLEPGGWLAFEHGYDQAEPCRHLLKAAGFRGIESRRDIAGHERVTIAQRA